MSGSTSVSQTALLFPSMPGVYPRNAIYDPTWGDPSYALYSGKRIVPAIDSIVKNPDGSALWVVSVDPATYYPKYSDVIANNNAINGVSFYNLNNSRLCLYIDTRTTPYVVTPDGKLVIEGVSPRSYRIVRYPGTPQETTISQYFDATGTFVSPLVPLVKISENRNLWYLQSCRIVPLLEQNEEIRIDIVDETGAVIRDALMFAAKSAIINESLIYRPMITGISITANQTLPDGTFFLFQNQNKDSLHITATLTYNDGHTADITPGVDNCYLYGLEDFIPSFPGLKQSLTLRYVLGDNETAEQTLLDTTTGSVFVDVPVTVVSTDMKVPVKISIVPVWNTALNQYSVSYLMYRTDGKTPADVTQYVTLTKGTLDPTPKSFGLLQSIVMSVDMSQIDPAAYSVKTLYTQAATITFKPNTAYIKWLIMDAMSSLFTYGQDSSIARRPVLYFDKTRGQYFVPTLIFGNSAAFLESFYYQAAPPYDNTVESIPPTPTHFVLREPIGMAMRVAAPIAVADYAKAFSLLNDSTGNFVNGTILVEFLSIDGSGNTETLYGVPVDVTTGTYVGP